MHRAFSIKDKKVLLPLPRVSFEQQMVPIPFEITRKFCFV